MGRDMNIQFKKGALDICVLALLMSRDRYGFELAASVSAHIDISEGTVYPILRRLKEEGHVDTYLRESTEGPPRKYYTITDSGREHFTELYAQWKEFVKSVENIAEGDTEL